MRLHLFSNYLILRNFNEKFSNLVSGVIFAENYVSVDENIAYDLLSAYLSLRDYYRFNNKKFYTVESFYTYLIKKQQLTRFSNSMQSDSVFFAWLFFHGKVDAITTWRKTINELENYVETKKGEY